MGRLVEIRSANIIKGCGVVLETMEEGETERERSGTREGWKKSGVKLALMTGAPRATRVQLSPLPTSAMSDQHNKT